MDFIVVGGGALGLATAEALRMQGAEVAVLEQGEVGHESSWAGGGILSPLCPWDYPEEVTRLAMRGAAKFSDWVGLLHAETGIDPQYIRCGMQVLQPFDSNKARQWCNDHRVTWEGSGGGMFLPEVAQVRNPRLMQALHARVRQLGISIEAQCEVREVLVERDHVSYLETSRGRFVADRYIVAAGAWSNRLLGSNALSREIKPVRGQMLLFKFDEPPLPHIVLQGDLYLIPRQDGHLLVGSTLEDVGFDKSVTQSAREDLHQRAQAILPSLRNKSVVKQWSGLRPASPGNLPAIGQHPVLQNLYLNSGHFRYGVTMAPASVEILLNELHGRAQPFEVSAYRT